MDLQTSDIINPQSCYFTAGIEFNWIQPKESIVTSLFKRQRGELQQKTRNNAYLYTTPNSIHYCYKEKMFSHNKGLDKIFSSLWMDDYTIITGTKDTKLLLWDATNFRSKPREIQLPRSNYQSELTGIHSLAKSPNGMFLVSGGINSAELIVFNDALKPLLILKGHTGLVFGADFLSEDYIVSGGRDGNVCLWRVDPVENPVESISPNRKRSASSYRIRAIQANRYSKYFCTLGTEGSVKFWDSIIFEEIDCVTLFKTNELVSLAIQHDMDLIAVGSQNFITIVDKKTKKQIADIPYNDTWGIRSLSWNGFIITIGGGDGTLSFFDLRNRKYVELESNGTKTQNLSSRKGYLVRDSFYFEYFYGNNIPFAIYTHSYNPSKSYLFTGGGPLMANLKGCYAAIW